VDKRQYAIVAVIGLLAAFIGGGIALLATNDDSESIRTDGTTTSSSSTLPTSTVPPNTAATAPPPTAAAAIPPETVVPGTIVTVPTTRPPVTTTTHAPPTTTTTHERGGSDTGISGTEIHLAVIADDPTPFQGMNAWMTSVNKHGGIADRKVRLDLFDTHGSADGYLAAVTSACNQDFAIVGSLSDFDSPAGAVDCAAIPDLPVEATPDHGAAANTFAAFPRNALTVAAGPYRWMVGNVDGCCQPFTLVPDSEPARARTLTMITAAQSAGFESGDTADVSASDGPDRYTEIVGQIDESASTFAESGLGLQSTVLLRQAAGGSAPGVKAWYCDARCYDSSFVAGGGAAVEDELIGIETTPFTDKDQVDALRAYIHTTKHAGVQPTYTGLRAYVAGLLFERSAKAVVDASGNDGLTRVRLLDTLAGIHDFDGGGIIGTTDVGARTPTGCSVLLRVHNGRFTRTNPSAKGSLDCAPDNLVRIGP
jgi:Periplasmic binding protein